MNNDTLTLSQMSDGQVVEGTPVIPYVESEFSGERNSDGSYTVNNPDRFITLPPEVARRIAAHIMETDEYAE